MAGWQGSHETGLVILKHMKLLKRASTVLVLSCVTVHAHFLGELKPGDCLPLKLESSRLGDERLSLVAVYPVSDLGMMKLPLL